MTLADIDQRITDLRQEAKTIEDIYKQLAEFLQANSMLPFDDAFVDYLQYFIEEENGKRAMGADNANVIENLNRMKNDFEDHIKRFKAALQPLPNFERQKRTALTPENIIDLINRIFGLPINGGQIRAQVDGIGVGQGQILRRKECRVQLPEQAGQSRVMQELIRILDQ